MSVGTPPAWNVAFPPSIPLRRFTVDEYHRLLDAGVFAPDERFELLEGWIVDRVVRTPPHAVTIGLISEALRDRLPAGWRVRLQSAITTADSEPEPDLVVVRGAIRDHIRRHPGPADIALVIEVADSSLAQDRDLKSRLYARAGIPVYGIVNLVARRVEVYTDPTGPAVSPGYGFLQDYGEEEFVAWTLGGQEVGPIAVRDLLA